MSAPGPGGTPSGAAPNVSESARQLFEASLRKRPWCSNHGHGRYPRVLPKGRGETLYLHPAAATVGACLPLIFDYDRDGAWWAAAEAVLPAPTLTVINLENGHGHLAFGLSSGTAGAGWAPAGTNLQRKQRGD